MNIFGLIKDIVLLPINIVLDSLEVEYDSELIHSKSNVDR